MKKLAFPLPLGDLMGEGEGGGDPLDFVPPHLNPLPCLRPARQGYAQAGARGEEIVWLLSAEYHLIKRKGGIYEKGFGFGVFCYGYGKFNRI